jgi:hypothetical protein
MTKTIKKTYIAPAAELILLAPMEALAAPSISTEDKVALQHWGYKPFGTAASVTSKRTYWGENGKISKK